MVKAQVVKVLLFSEAYPFPQLAPVGPRLAMKQLAYTLRQEKLTEMELVLHQ
jgi:hypothetical protein